MEDALHATRAAVEEGIVAGGGVALIRCISAIEAVKGANDDEQIGVDIIKRAVEGPLRSLAANAGVEGSLIVQEVKKRKGNEGYNVATGEYEDLVKAGVVDPKKVTRSALQNAASIAGLTTLLTTRMPHHRRSGKGQSPGWRRRSWPRRRHGRHGRHGRILIRRKRFGGTENRTRLEEIPAAFFS